MLLFCVKGQACLFSASKFLCFIWFMAWLPLYKITPDFVYSCSQTKAFPTISYVLIESTVSLSCSVSHRQRCSIYLWHQSSQISLWWIFMLPLSILPPPEFSFFDPSEPHCREVLLDPSTTIPELFAVLRQWVPQVQKNINVIGNEVNLNTVLVSFITANRK